jgi:methionyl aminopeptidase
MITVILNGYYGDTSTMFSVGKIHPKHEKLIAVTKECLDEAIKILKPGLHLGDIGAIITEIAHKNRFSVVEDFCVTTGNNAYEFGRMLCANL